MLRMPEGMRARFAEIAERNGRSLNMELVHRLKASLEVLSDIAEACRELSGVTDRLDFAVRIFQKAGLNVSIPEDE